MKINLNPKMSTPPPVFSVSPATNEVANMEYKGSNGTETETETGAHLVTIIEGT